MAEKSGQEKSLGEIKQQIAHSRDWLARDLSGLRYELDFPLKFKKAFQRHTVVWVGAALALGLCVALLRARTQKVYVNKGGSKVGSSKSLLESGALIALLKLGMTLVQPVIVSHFAKKGAKRGGEKARPARTW